MGAVSRNRNRTFVDRIRPGIIEKNVFGIDQSVTEHSGILGIDRFRKLLSARTHEYFPQFLAGEPRSLHTECGNGQGRNARNLWRGHRGSCGITVTAVRRGAENAESFVAGSMAAQSREIDPRTVVGPGDLTAVDAQRRYGHHFLVGSREHRVGNAVVARGKNDDAAFHGTCLIAVLIAPGILDKIVDGRFTRLRQVRKTGDISPAVLADDGPMVGRPDHDLLDRRGIASRFVENLATHQPHTASGRSVAPRDAADADAVVVDGADRACDMRAVAAGSDLRIMAAEVVAAGALSVAPDIRCQIGMRIVDAAVHHGDDDVFMSGADAPCRKNVEVGHGRRSDRSAHPVVNPLIDQQRIIESGDCDIVRT